MASSSVEWDQGASVKLDEGGRASKGDSRWSSGGWDGNEMMGRGANANGAGAKADAAAVKTSIGPTCLVGKSATSVQRRY